MIKTYTMIQIKDSGWRVTESFKLDDIDPKIM